MCAYIFICTHVFIYTCIYIYMHAYMCKYIYFQENTLGQHYIFIYNKIIYYFFTRVRSGIHY